MKKLALLAAGVAALGLGSCKKEMCPAYTGVKSTKAAPVVASTAAPAARM